MDLRAWIVADHDGIGTRFTSNVAAHVPLDRWRERAGGTGASIAALVFHVAWHEDLAVATAVDGATPLLESWRADLGLGGVAPHAGLGEAEDPELTARLDLEALQSYWSAARTQTASWLATTQLDVLDDVPPATNHLEKHGVTAAEVPWLHRNWADKPVSFFLQWEAIGHPQNHLGEMISVRGRLGLSPF